MGTSTAVKQQRWTPLAFQGHWVARNVLLCALPALKFKKIILYHQIHLAPEWRDIQNKPNPFTNTTTLEKTYTAWHEHIRKKLQRGETAHLSLSVFKKWLKTEMTMNYFRENTVCVCVCVSNILSASRLVPKSAHMYSHLFSKFYFLLVNS